MRDDVPIRVVDRVSNQRLVHCHHAMIPGRQLRQILAVLVAQIHDQPNGRRGPGAEDVM